MARNREGFTLRQTTPGGVWYVRFRCGGRSPERSTGTRDKDEAAKEARRIYADAIAREKQQPVKRIRSAAVALEGIVGGWLASLATTHDAGTLKTWELYAGTHFIPFFDAVHNLTTAQAELYMLKRLGEVQASTVRHEHTALRSLGRWAKKNHFIPEVMIVPTVPKHVTGTPYGKRRRVTAPEISPEEIEALISSLPKWSTSKKVEPFPIRALFRIRYETGLRPELLQDLSAPLHYRKGQTTIHITKGLDKNRWARDVPLTQAARDTLDEVLDELTRRGREAGTVAMDAVFQGPIFGKHDYRHHLRIAAASVLTDGRDEQFNGAHTRSARATHMLEEGANLPGVMFLFGWKLVSTASNYVKPTGRAARAALATAIAPKNPSKLGAPNNSG